MLNKTLQYLSFNLSFKKFIAIHTLVILGLSILLIIFVSQDRLYLSDFKVYYGAARDLLHLPIVYNDQTVEATGLLYDKAYGLASGYYKYSPSFSFLVIPFAVLPWKFAAILYYILITIMISFIPLFAYSIINLTISEKLKSKVSITSIYILTLCITATHLYRELWLGNVNLLLVYLLLLAIFFLYHNNEKRCSGLIAVCLIIKPHFVLLLPIFVLVKKYKLFLYSIGFTILFLILPVIVLGWEKVSFLLMSWVKTMQSHNELSNLFDTHTTIFYQLKNIFGNQIITPSFFYLTLLFMMIIYLLFHSHDFKFYNTNRKRTRVLILYIALMMAVIPNITVTDTEHFLYSIPLIIAILITFKKMRLPIQILTIFSFIGYGGNIYDLIGYENSLALQKWGVLGISNFILIIIVRLSLTTPKIIFKTKNAYV